MDIFYILVLGFIIAGVIAYAVVTDKIIKNQDRQIAALYRKNKRLRSEITSKKAVEVISFYEQPKGVNIPSFDKEW